MFYLGLLLICNILYINKYKVKKKCPTLALKKNKLSILIMGAKISNMEFEEEDALISYKKRFIPRL